MKVTDNYKKHTHTNPLQRLLLENFFKTLVSIIRPLSVRSILDVGCGEGFTLNRLQQENIGEKLEGVDFLKTAIQLGEKQYPQLTLKEGSIYDLQYKNNSFDLVFCTEVLEHLEDPQKALKELVRVSKKYLLLSVPNEPWFMLSNFLRGKNWSRWGNDIEHINHWSSSRFEQFVSAFGLHAVVKKHPFPWTMLLMKK